MVRILPRKTLALVACLAVWLVSIASGAATPTPRSVTATKATVVYTKPSDKSDPVTMLSAGAVADFLGIAKGGKWVRIKSSDGKTGYALRAALTIGNRPEKGRAHPKKSKKATRATAAAVRTSPAATTGNAATLAPSGKVGLFGFAPYQGRLAMRVEPAFMRVQQTVVTSEAFRYDMRALAWGIRARGDWEIAPNFMGGVVTARGSVLLGFPGKIPVPNTDPEVLLSSNIVSASGEVVYERGSLFGVEDLTLVAEAGDRVHVFRIEPQTTSYYLSTWYNSLFVGLGARYPVSIKGFTFDVDGGMRGLYPGLVLETFGKGQSGSSGKSPSTWGIDTDLGATYSLDFADVGVRLGYMRLQSQFEGEGRRGGVTVFETRLVDSVFLASVSLDRAF